MTSDHQSQRRAERDDDGRVNVHVHADPAVAVLLSEVLNKLNHVLVVLDQQGVAMSQLSDDLAATNAKLDEAAETANEVAADIEALVAAAADAPANSAAAADAKAKAHALADRLRAVANVHTTTPTEPPPEV